MPSNDTQTEIELDDDVLNEVIATLTSVADNLDEVADASITEAERMISEMKGDNSDIPPVYQDIGDALTKTMNRMKRVNAELVGKLRADAKIIKNQIEAQNDVQTTSATDITSIDTNFDIS